MLSSAGGEKHARGQQGIGLIRIGNTVLPQNCIWINLPRAGTPLGVATAWSTIVLCRCSLLRPSGLHLLLPYMLTTLLIWWLTSGGVFACVCSENNQRRGRELIAEADRLRVNQAKRTKQRSELEQRNQKVYSDVMERQDADRARRQRAMHDPATVCAICVGCRRISVAEEKQGPKQKSSKGQT